MRSNLIRLIALLCALLMLATCAIACAESDPEDTDKTPSEDTSDPSEDNDPEEDKETVYKANIPDGFSYGTDDPFTVYAYPTDVFVWKDYDWQHSGGLTGDRINDAVFKRTSQVEEELSMDIEFFCGASYSNPSEFTTAITTGDDTYDVGNVSMRNHLSMVKQGQVLDLSEMTALDIEAPWWDQHLREDLTIYDKYFCLTGDIGTMYKRSIGAIIFNKVLIDEYSLESPYALVENNEWTLEMLIEMTENVSLDINSDDLWTEEDRYGIILFDGAFDSMMIGADVYWATRDADGVPEMSMYGDRAVDTWDLIAELLFDTERAYNVYNHGQNEQVMWDIFMDDRALFYYGELHSAEDMRANISDFGILPMPKLDEYQENYAHTINAGVAAVLVVPMTNDDMQRTAYVLDSLGAASKNILTPAYYDLNLKSVVSRDDESEAMLDIIFSSLRYDMGYLFVPQANSMIRSLGRNFSTDLASSYSANEGSFETEIENLITAILNKY
ncbi:MAG: hypothetical protein IJW97_00445 [Clostridia bacterium]|nr:hypothetical protein [Clostridia bacterium]